MAKRTPKAQGRPKVRGKAKARGAGMFGALTPGRRKVRETPATGTNYATREPPAGGGNTIRMVVWVPSDLHRRAMMAGVTEKTLSALATNALEAWLRKAAR